MWERTCYVRGCERVWSLRGPRDAPCACSSARRLTAGQLADAAWARGRLPVVLAEAPTLLDVRATCAAEHAASPAGSSYDHPRLAERAACGSGQLPAPR
eukprot:351893-Chlamydomonas_euryale.AAC.5